MSPRLGTRFVPLVFAIMWMIVARTAFAEDISRDAMRLLHSNCLSCHNTEKQKGGLAMDSRETLLKGGDSGPVLTEKRDESMLLKVLSADADPHMPPKKQLSTNQIALMRRWLEADAPWNSEALAQASSPRSVKIGEAPASFRPVLALAMTLDGKKLVIGRRNEAIVHDLSATNFPMVQTVTTTGDAVRAVAWSSNGELLAAGSYRELSVWRAGSPDPVWRGTNLNGRITALRFSPFGGALLAGDSAIGGGATIHIFNAENGREISSWEAHADAIHEIAMSGDGGFLASAGGDKLVKLWEVISQREIGQIENAGAPYGLAFSTNATELVTVGADKQLKVWDIATRESVVTIPGRKHAFNAVAWSRDGRTVVAGDEAGAVQRFTDFKRHTGAQSSETAREKHLAKWPEAIHALAINGDATRIAAGGQDGTVYLIDGEGKLQHKFLPEEQTNLVSAAEGPSFVRDVLPMMAKAGCMAGSCHAKADGQNGFKLSVFSYDPKSDYAEIVKEARGRRVFPAAPEESLLLLKPTMAVEHGGGERIEVGSDTYKTLIEWIRGGMPYQHANEPTLASISVEPREGIYKKNAAAQLKVQAHYSDGTRRDVTHLAEFVSNEKEIVKVSESGSMQIGVLEGESVIVTRFMGFVDASRVTVPAERTLPAERYAKLPVNNFIDRMAYEQFRKLGLYPSDGCSDSEFMRRSTLDAIGMLPSPEEARGFLADESPGKRQRWIEYLLDHPAYGDYWANKWADLLRPNPDRVGVKSIFYLDQWLRDSFAANKPFDQFVREILVAEGSNHEEGPVAIYRDRREPPELTTMFGQLFLGVRMECAKCHHHPTEKWTQDDFYQLAAHFGALKQKGAGLSPPISAGTETFYFAKGGSVRHPVTEEVMKPRALDAKNEVTNPEEDPRVSLANWVTARDNAFFAKAAVNRVWAVFFGRGFVEPVDDFRISNPAVNEPLLNALAADFREHGYDLKHAMRTIMNSRLYQLSSVPNNYNLHDTRNFSRSLRRRLPAEVLLDAVNDVTGVQDEFNGCPPGTRAIQTWSYKVRSHFMDAFGRPNSSTDCPCERDARTSVVQSLHMMNSKALQTKLSDPGGRVKKLADGALQPEDVVTELYLASFSRLPTRAELQAATAPFSGEKVNRQHATEDVLWALLNSPEFVFNH